MDRVKVREGRERNSNTDRWIGVEGKKMVRREGGDNRKMGRGREAVGGTVGRTRR